MDVMNKHKHEPGFTIIEVSLVLAIAGLVVGNLSDTRPFNNYVQNSGLPKGTDVKVWPNATQIGLTTVSIFGRLIISPGTVCAQPSVAFESGAVTGIIKQGAVSVWTVLEEGERGVVYCQDG